MPGNTMPKHRQKMKDYKERELLTHYSCPQETKKKKKKKKKEKTNFLIFSKPSARFSFILTVHFYLTPYKVKLF